MRNNGACRIVGTGYVLFSTSTGRRMLPKVVHHVPHIRLNLLSEGRLDDEGYRGNFRNSSWKFCKGNLIVARA